MTKSEIQKLDKRLQKSQVAVAKERDRLDNVIDEAEGLKESCRNAWDRLQDARDALSELV